LKQTKRFHSTRQNVSSVGEMRTAGKLCGDDIESGYINIEGKKNFYYLFAKKRRRDQESHPEKIPLILWLNGGTASFKT
jgi:carboxypeptidase C (cathepsin A)